MPAPLLNSQQRLRNTRKQSKNNGIWQFFCLKETQKNKRRKMEKTPLSTAILENILEANLVYQAGNPPEVLAMLAEVFSQDLAGENVESINAAFALHRRRSTRFPTPAHIIALLPECRVSPRLDALPQTTMGKKTVGAGRLAFAAFKGDRQAKEALGKLVGKACGKASA